MVEKLILFLNAVLWQLLAEVPAREEGPANHQVAYTMRTGGEAMIERLGSK
jgi:hypothetical protein